MARRNRTGPVAIKTALEAVDKFTTALNPALIDDGEPHASIDYQIEYTYISPTGTRMGVSKSHLEGQEDGWPMPGTYEIVVLDSNGDPLHDEPFRAVEHDKDSLLKAGSDVGENNTLMRLFNTVAEESRITIGSQRADLERSRQRERQAREDFEKQLDVTVKLQRERNDLVLAAERAKADKDLAEQRRIEAEQALEELQRQIAEMKPQLATIVDRGLDRLGQLIGLPPSAANETANATDAQVGGGQQRRDEAPRPECAVDPQKDTLELLAVLLGNDEVLASMVQEGLITWNQARSIWWGLTGKDLGPEPDWSEWSAAHESDEPQEGAA